MCSLVHSFKSFTDHLFSGYSSKDLGQRHPHPPANRLLIGQRAMSNTCNTFLNTMLCWKGCEEVGQTISLQSSLCEEHPWACWLPSAFGCCHMVGQRHLGWFSVPWKLARNAESLDVSSWIRHQHPDISECTRWGKVVFGDKDTLMCFQRLAIVADSRSIRKFGLLEGRRS